MVYSNDGTEVTLTYFTAMSNFDKMKIYQDNAGHMTKMAAMLIYGKTL